MWTCQANPLVFLHTCWNCHLCLVFLGCTWVCIAGGLANYMNGADLPPKLDINGVRTFS
jgi:hypothetical protein